MLQKKDKNGRLFFKESSYQVAGLIFNRPSAVFHLRQLAKETGLSTTAVDRAVRELQNYQIITVQDTGLTRNIQADPDSDAYRFYKRVFNLYQLSSFIEALKLSFQAKTIVIFGSFAKGEDVEESDVDILIISNRAGGEKVEKLSKTMEKKLNRTIALHVLGSLDKSEPEFRNAVANGIVVYGYLKVI